MNGNRRKMQKVSVAVAILGTLLAGGCAVNDTIPGKTITTAEKAITDAKESTATVDAAGELKIAEDKLAEAKAAMADKDYEKAGRLADEALVDADYARAKSTTVKAKKTADETRESIRSLQQELERTPAQ